jgi:hypothetical protein
MAQVRFHCSCASSSTVKSVRLSVVNMDPAYGTALACGTSSAEGKLLDRIAKPTDIPTASPLVLIELLDQTRSCTLACIAWRDKSGAVFPCSDIREVVLRQGGYASPQQAAPRRG